MGALVLASLFCLGFLLVECKPANQNQELLRSNRQLEPNYNQYYIQPAQKFDQTKGISVEQSVTPARLETSATNYEPYVKHYHFTVDDAVDNKYGNPVNSYQNSYQYQVVDGDDERVKEFSSIEQDSESYDDPEFQNQESFSDVTGFKHYDTKTSFRMTGPRQVEKITTKSYHKEVEPYDVSGFHQSAQHEGHHHDDDTEVHYHEHKHMHKHQHKQEHVHKHKNEHKHEHGHKHKHEGQHKHGHENKHHHKHEGHHKHGHKHDHHHKHKQEHKHEHHNEHKHDHHHHQEHKHDAHHGHKHSHHDEHKHDHHNDHKHDHHHGHSHHNDHKHDHHQKHEHKHHEEHKHNEKHEHKSHHHHKHSHSKH